VCDAHTDFCKNCGATRFQTIVPSLSEEELLVKRSLREIIVKHVPEFELFAQIDGAGICHQVAWPCSLLRSSSALQITREASAFLRETSLLQGHKLFVNTVILQVNGQACAHHLLRSYLWMKASSNINHNTECCAAGRFSSFSVEHFRHRSFD